MNWRSISLRGNRRGKIDKKTFSLTRNQRMGGVITYVGVYPTCNYISFTTCNYVPANAAATSRYIETEQPTGGREDRVERTEEGGRERERSDNNERNDNATTFGDDHNRDILLMVLHFAGQDCPFRVRFLVLAKKKKVR